MRKYEKWRDGALQYPCGCCNGVCSVISWLNPGFSFPRKLAHDGSRTFLCFLVFNPIPFLPTNVTVTQNVTQIRYSYNHLYLLSSLTDVRACEMKNRYFEVEETHLRWITLDGADNYFDLISLMCLSPAPETRHHFSLTLLPRLLLAPLEKYLCLQFWHQFSCPIGRKSMAKEKFPSYLGFPLLRAEQIT